MKKVEEARDPEEATLAFLQRRLPSTPAAGEKARPHRQPQFHSSPCFFRRLFNPSAVCSLLAFAPPSGRGRSPRNFLRHPDVALSSTPFLFVRNRPIYFLEIVPFPPARCQRHPSNPRPPSHQVETSLLGVFSSLIVILNETSLLEKQKHNARFIRGKRSRTARTLARDRNHLFFVFFLVGRTKACSRKRNYHRLKTRGKKN